MDLATSCYEHACSKFPNSLELMMGLFNCYVREYSFVKQQQVCAVFLFLFFFFMVFCFFYGYLLLPYFWKILTLPIHFYGLQTAIKMYKLAGEERFLLWAVCSIQLQVLPSLYCYFFFFSLPSLASYLVQLV